MSKIYISGPISGHEPGERREEFKKVQKLLELQGYEVVNPMENGLPPTADTCQHMKRDVELILQCDEIYMMKKWNHSAGCKLEFDLATAIGLPVIFEQVVGAKFV